MTRLEREFWQYHHDHPDVYDALRRLALDAIERRGYTHMGIAALWEILRWERRLDMTDGVFKANNNYRAYYARLLMEREPQLVGFFRLRGVAA